METNARDVFRAVSDPTRRRLLDLLRAGEKTVSDLRTSFRVSQPALSQHLRVLRDAGLVRVRREGRFHFYGLEPDPLKEVHAWVGHYERFWSGKPDGPAAPSPPS